MHPNAALIRDFYACFARRDGEGMAALYADDVHFSDPVFPDLHGDAAGDMWRMLCSRAADLTVETSGIDADDTTGRAHWEAHYTFSATGRRVHNIIDARFELRGGKIVRHVDTFDFWRWSRQALGPAGLLLGWTPLLRNKVRRTAAQGLAAFRAKAAARP